MSPAAWQETSIFFGGSLCFSLRTLRQATTATIFIYTTSFCHLSFISLMGSTSLIRSHPIAPFAFLYYDTRARRLKAVPQFIFARMLCCLDHAFLVLVPPAHVLSVAINLAPVSVRYATLSHVFAAQGSLVSVVMLHAYTCIISSPTVAIALLHLLLSQ
ncbi:hypothetical protein C8T65DRAFT_107124 [Cerioporus squamosus]|nr:hypothetical protein C8T65DRAFT_107124 [Cerioporus squamosus]